MGYVFRLISALVIAIYVGFALSQFALNSDLFLPSVEAGPWTARPGAGSANADPYTSAEMARSGSISLGRSEGMRFIASTDSAGQVLSGRCRYRLSGLTPVATLWTLYAIDFDKRVVSSAAGHASLNSHQVSRFRDGRFQIKVSPDLQQGNWLRVDSAEEIQLVLTLYDSNIFLGGGSDIGEMPVIERENCL